MAPARACIAAIVLAAAPSTAPPPAPPTAAPAPTAGLSDAAVPALDSIAQAALLVHLVDLDGAVARWANVQSPTVCGEGTRVWVNDAPVVTGAELPTASFTLDWHLVAACPLGDAGPVLAGRLRMIVWRDDAFGLVPRVVSAPQPARYAP